jgi:ABC-type transporter Mla MlaB component
MTPLRRSAVAAFAGLVLVGAVAGCSSEQADDDTAQSPAPTTSAAAGAAPAEVDVPDAAEVQVADGVATEQVAEAVETIDTLVSDQVAAVLAPADGAASLEDVASGAVLEELANELQELDSNDWTQTGAPVLSDMRIEQADDSSMTVSVCVDSSGVTTLDSAGVALPAGTTPRAVNVYTLTLVDGAWLVTNRTFPENPAC